MQADLQPTNWTAAKTIYLSTLSGDQVSLLSILQGNVSGVNHTGKGGNYHPSGESPPSQGKSTMSISPSTNASPLGSTGFGQKTVLVFLRKFNCPTCYSYILLFSHLKPVLKSRNIKIAFVTCHTSLSEVKIFIKAFAFWLKSVGDEDGLSPLPGQLYLDPERKAYAFFGIGMKMSVIRGLGDLLTAKFRDAFGMLRSRSSHLGSLFPSSPSTPLPPRVNKSASPVSSSASLPPVDSRPSLAEKQSALAKVTQGIGARLPEIQGSLSDDTILQSPGIVLVQNQIVLYRYVSKDNANIMDNNATNIARILTDDQACALPDESPQDVEEMLAQFTKELESPGDSARVEGKDLIFGEKLGSGRIATVYKSRWLGMDVAVKYFNTREHEAGTENSRSISFTNEVSIMMSLRHPSICTMMAFGSRDERLFLVMEFVDNGSLFDLLATSVELTSLQKQIILLDIAEGMKYLHGCSPTIIHQDLKSLNILMTKDYRAKISDFGIASEFRRGPIDRSEPESSEKSENAHGGTFPWMSPEYIQGVTAPSPKWDVFAFAVICWEVGTERKPWYKCTRDYLIKKVMSGERLVIESRWNWNPRFVSLINDCWHQSPSARPDFSRVVKRMGDSWLVVSPGVAT